MATTYSPSLRITLIGEGLQSGTWGETTNVNLGGVIEQAITGYLEVTIDAATKVLTVTNDVDEARNAVIYLNQGAVATNFAVFVPPVEKLYVFNNQTTRSATIYCSSVVGNTTPRGLGVTIPAGGVIPVYSDGTDIVAQCNYTPSNFVVGGNLGVVGSATFTGIPSGPTAPAGTSTTQLATTAFVNAVAGALGTISTQNANAVAITGGTMSGMTSIADTIGNVRNLPINAKTATYVLLVTDAGQVVSITTGGVTVPPSIFSAGQAISVYNNSAVAQTITQGVGVTMTLASSGLTGNRTLGGYGLCTILCLASNTFVITGAGVS